MPTYNYECPKCHKTKEAFRSIKDRNSFACDCGQIMEIVIVSAPNHPKEMLRHFDNGLGCYVQDRSDRKRIMRERGLREAGDSGEPMTKELKEIREADIERNHRTR
jgi:putative FmdB family regulatory protein